MESLRRIHEEASDIEVAAVVTAPDRPAGRGHAPRMSAVKQYALSAGIPVLQPEKLRDEAFVATLRSIAADLFVVIAFRMMPEVVWAMPSRHFQSPRLPPAALPWCRAHQAGSDQWRDRNRSDNLLSQPRHRHRAYHCAALHNHRARRECRISL